MNVNIEIIRSRRRSISITVDGPDHVTVRAPSRMTDREIRAFVDSKRAWLEKHLAIAAEKREAAANAATLTQAEMNTLVNAAKTYIPQRVEYYSRLMGVKCSGITIRCQKTRWGSCSSRGSLNFNCLLMLAPAEEVDYVVVHELCHLKEMNHSPRFWAEVAKVMPDYRTRVAWFKKHGTEIMSRRPE